VGSEVSDVRPGDAVLGASFVGAFAEKVTAHAAGLVKLPPGADFAAAAALWVCHGTAYHALRSVAEVQKDDWVVVLGAAGGGGLAAVEIAQVLAGRVLAAASSDEKLAVCRARGAEATVNYTTEDLKTRV